MPAVDADTRWCHDRHACKANHDGEKRGPRAAQQYGDAHTDRRGGADVLPQGRIDSVEREGAKEGNGEPPAEIIRMAQRSRSSHDDRITGVGLIRGGRLKRVDAEILEDAVDR